MNIFSMIKDAYKTYGLLTTIRFCICIIPILTICALIILLHFCYYLIQWFVKWEKPDYDILINII